ncbi:MAG: hypothetical protein U5N86_03635 [Planctomycetota bacterium]|nr:hypothetical protein [Planctomycetota bacterium]
MTMRVSFIRQLALMAVIVLCATVFAASEQVESLGPQLIGDGGFIGNDGGEPPRPAGWVIDSSGGANALWLEKGYRDKGRAHLVSTSSDGSLRMNQKRWAGGSDCYLLSFFWQGNAANVRVSVSLNADDARVLCRSSRKLFSRSSWREERLFLDIFPAGLEGHLVTSFEGTGKFDLHIDHASLRAYEGPYTRVNTRFDDQMPFAPAENTQVISPVLFTWPTVPWADRYEIVLATEFETYSTRSIPLNVALLETRKKLNLWRVYAIKGEKRLALGLPMRFNCTQTRKPAPVRLVKPQLPPPVTSNDVEQWNKTVLASTCEPLLPQQFELSVQAIPQSSPGREFALLKLNRSWDEAAYALRLLCNMALVDIVNSRKRAANLLAHMTRSIAAAEPYLSGEVRASLALAACGAERTGLDRGQCSAIAKTVLGNPQKHFSACLSNPSDYDSLRLTAAAVICQATGILAADNSVAALAFLAAGRRWFFERSTPLPGAILASDLPLFISASRCVAGVPGARTLEEDVLASCEALYWDFPSQFNSSFGYSTINAPRKAASLLAYFAGVEGSGVPPHALCAYSQPHSALFPLQPLEEPAKLSALYAQHGLAHCLSAAVMPSALSVRASDFGTAYPFGASQGAYRVSYAHRSLAGAGVFAPSSMPRQFRPLLSAQAFPAYSVAGRLLQAGNPAADASISSFCALGSLSVSEMDLSATQVDIIRSERRSVACLIPPGMPPLVLCRDEFSNYFDRSAVMTSRIPAPITTDRVNQTFSSKNGGAKGIVASPRGSQLTALRVKNPFISFIRPENIFGAVACSAKAADRAALIAITAHDGPALEPRNGDDFLGVRFGAGFAAFHALDGGMYMVNGLLTDAAFIAAIPLEGGKRYICASSVTTVDENGKSIFSSDEPVAFELLLAGEKVEKFNAVGKGKCRILGNEKDLVSSLLLKREDARLRLRSDLFSADSVEEPYYLSTLSRRLLVIPAVLNGAYSVEVSGKAPQGATAILNAPSFRAVELEPDERGELSSTVEFVGGGRCALSLALAPGVEIERIEISPAPLLNAGFEQFSKGVFEGFRTEGARITQDRNFKAEGEAALRGVIPAGKTLSVSTSARTSPGYMTLEADIYMKGENKRADLAAYAQLTFYDAKGRETAKSVETRPEKALEVWKKLRFRTRVPRNAVRAGIRFIFEARTGSADIWLDDVSLSR